MVSVNTSYLTLKTHWLAQIKESDDKEERALKEYWRQNYGRAAQLAEEAAQAAVEESKRAPQRTAAASLIRRYALAGNAWHADNKFRETLLAYSRIEEHFENKRISREDFMEEWAALMLLMGDTKCELGSKGEGVAGPRLLAEAIAAYRQAATFYTHAQSPQQWAKTQHNLGFVSSELGKRAEGRESLRYLNEATVALRATLEVFTRDQMPQDWEMTQNYLAQVRRTLASRAQRAGVR